MVCSKKNIFLFLLLWPSFVFSHPVIWKGGTVFTFRSLSNTPQINLHYSYNRHWALGVHGIKLNKKQYGMFQSNFLLRRWNRQGSQANFYMFLGLGSHTKTQKDTILHFGSQVDWETRRLYTQLETHGFFSKDTTYLMSLRMGASPYLSDYEGLHSWIILQLSDKVTENSHQITFMPVLRLFLDNYLVEFGSNFSGRNLVTLMFHF